MREQMTQNASLIRAAVVLLLSSLWGWLGAGAVTVVVAVAVAVVVTGSAWAGFARAGFARAEVATALVGVGAGVFIVVVERLREPRGPGGAYLSSSVLEYAWGVSNAGVKCAAGSTRAEALEPARVAGRRGEPEEFVPLARGVDVRLVVAHEAFVSHGSVGMVTGWWPQDDAGTKALRPLSVMPMIMSSKTHMICFGALSSGEV